MPNRRGSVTACWPMQNQKRMQTMLRIEIDPALTRDFPDICVAAIRVTRLEGIAEHIAAQSDLAEAKAEIMTGYGGDIERLVADPRIATWREAYRRVNAKPSKYRSSVEALARRALKTQPLDTGIALVDCYNAVSLRHRAPLGAADIGRLPADMIALRYSRPTDRFDPIGSHPDGFHTVPPVAVYAADEEILCWGFNCRD